MNDDDSYVVAVIGDGALSGGLAFEGLNNAGRSKKTLSLCLTIIRCLYLKMLVLWQGISQA